MGSPTRYTDNFDPLTQLELDPFNPRLAREDKGADQARILELMITKFEVEEVAESIVASGYLPFDPLLGYPSPKSDGMIRIREGNRRIAAAILLLGPDRSPERYRNRWQTLASELKPEHRATIESLVVDVWPDASSSEMNSYIGFRHVNGIRPWPAAEKANFISQLIQSESYSYREIAEHIGSKPKHVERHYVAYALSQLAHDDGIPGADEMEQRFGVLIRALQAQGISEFIGVGYTGDPGALKLPSSTDETRNFADFVKWTFGTPDHPRLLPDSREITRLATVLQSDDALAYLRRSEEPSFEQAWQRAGGEATKLVEMLLVAADQLRDAVPIVADHLQDAAVLDAVDECRRFWSRIEREVGGANNTAATK